MIFIKNKFFFIFLLLCLIFIILLPENSDATTKKILVTGGKEIRGSVFSINDNFGGFVGDWISIETGKHNIKVKKGITHQETSIDIQEKTAKIIQSEIINGDTISKWAKPTISTQGEN